MRLIKPEESRGKLDLLRANKRDRGQLVGFNSLIGKLNIPTGSPVMFYGEPFSGKSEVAFEFAMNLIESTKCYVALFAVEVGDIEEIIASLIERRVGKEFHKPEVGSMSEGDYLTALEWLNEHFVIIVKDNDFEVCNLQTIYKAVEDYEISYAVSFKYIIIDPYTDLDEMKAGAAIHENTRHAAVAMRDHDKRTKCTTISIHHVNGQVFYDKESGKGYTKLPLPFQVKGGQNWFNLGMTMVGIYRPPVGIIEGVEDNEVWVDVRKYKKKATAERGMYKLFFDIRRQRYYEVIHGKNYFAFEYEKEAEGQQIQRIEPADLQGDQPW